MFLDRILNGVDRALAYKLMLVHIVIIAISNYLVQFKFNIFDQPLAVAAFTFPLVFFSFTTPSTAPVLQPPF